MKEYQRKKKIRRFLYSRLALCVLLALILLIGKATWSVHNKERESAKNLHRATEELAALEARQTSLTEKIERLKTPEGVEAEIREQFQVAKPGERMVVVVEDKTLPKEEEVKHSLVSRFFDIFR